MRSLGRPSRRLVAASFLLATLSAWHVQATGAQLTLTWIDNSTNETGFSVERATGTTGAFGQVGTTGAGVAAYTDLTLADATTYCYRVRAFNAAAFSAYSNVSCGTTPQTFGLAVVTMGDGSGTVISVPAGITCGTSCSARYPTGTAMTLTATPATGSTFAGWGGGGCGGANICSFVLTAATTVIVTFTALAAPDTTPPTAPPRLTATAVSSDQIALSWGAATDNIAVTGYRLERCQGALCSSFAQIATPAGTSVTDTGLSAATIYSYRVRATDAAGNLGPYSIVASATTPPAPSPPAAGPVAAYAFNEPSGSTTADSSGNGLTGVLTNGAAFAPGKTGNALSLDGVNDYVDLGIPPPLQISGSMTISAWINSRAFPVDDAAVVSQRGAARNGFQLDTTIDAGPRTIGFKLTNSSGTNMIRYGATALQLDQWYHVAGVYDATTQTMTVYLNGQPDNGSLLGTITAAQQPSGLTTTIGRRAGLTGYEFAGSIDDLRIYTRALSPAEIQTDMNAAVGLAASDTTPPTNPTGLTATAVGPTQINLGWTTSTDNVAVTGYRVEQCQGAGCNSFGQVATATGTSFSDTGLTAGVTYSYRVRAADAAGNLSRYSTIASATLPNAFMLTVSKGGTGSGTISSVPAGIACGTTCSASYVSGTAVTLTGSAAAGSIFTGWSGGGCSGSGSCTATVTGSTIVTATFTAQVAPDTTPPTAPPGLTAAAVNSSRITLSWGAATDNIAVTGYRLERCQGAPCSSFAQIATPAGTSVTDTGLSAATTYSYRVRATDAAGNLGAYSTVASATTPPRHRRR